MSGKAVAAKIRARASWNSTTFRRRFSQKPHPSPRAPSRSAPSHHRRLRARVRPHDDPWEIARVTAKQAEMVAGTAGDPAKIVEDLPGVARASLGSDPLAVWGSPASDTRVTVDGVEIPSLFPGDALRSTINGGLISSVTLTPGAYGADYGRALGGIVQVEIAAAREGRILTAYST